MDPYLIISPTKPAVCFAGSEMIQTQYQGSVPISSVRLGDVLLAYSSYKKAFI
jgi:hypothetical protein